MAAKLGLQGMLLYVVAAEGAVINTVPTYDYFLYAFIALGLILFGGLMSGLNVGMLSIDELELEQRIATGSEVERRQAIKILSVVEKHHWLLVSILLGNAAAAETLPIILGFIFNNITSVVLSVTFILFCGEIIPQAIMTGPNQIKIAGRFVPFVNVLMYVMAPLSLPLSLLLDKILGKVPRNYFTTQDLKHKINQHRSISDTSLDQSTSLNKEMLKMVTGAIELKEILVKDVMTPLDQVFAVSDAETLGSDLLRKLRKKGHSRVPVYRGDQKDQLFGYMLIEQFIGAKLPRRTSILESDAVIMRAVATTPNTDILTLMHAFKNAKSQIAFVTNPNFFHSPGEQAKIVPTIGIITLENVFEVVIQAEIKDEKDREGSVAYRGVSTIHSMEVMQSSG
jgi:CBS domain containing-hemolysin-like protein